MSDPDVPEDDTASVTNNIIATTPPPPPLESTTTDDTLRAQAEAAVALSLGTLSPDGLLTQVRNPPRVRRIEQDDARNTSNPSSAPLPINAGTCTGGYSCCVLSLDGLC